MKKYLFTITFSLLVSLCFAQEKPCGAAELINRQLQQNVRAQLSQERLEKFTQSWIEQSGEHRESTHEYIIPLVVHVFHDYTAGSFVSKDHVLDAIRILNRDIKALNPDTAQIDSAFQGVIGGLNVRFELAKIGPDGECTDGITRTYTPLTNEGDERLKSLISWDTDKYMNIWLCKSLSFNAGGYAFYPGTAPTPSQEGIVCITSQFGSVSPSFGTTSNLAARTITHEAGHYLNLRHTWGNSNSANDPNNCQIDDLVDDTPLCMGMSGACPLSRNSCNDTTYYGFDQKDNIQNYMDYAPCESMFTIGQADRMEAALNSTVGSRLYLWQDTNLFATGVHPSSPTVACGMKVDFLPQKFVVCEGVPVNFTDYSWNGTAQSRTWTFNRVSYTASSTSDSLISVTFTDTGYYDVTLEITSLTGVSTTLTKQRAIYVLENPSGTNQFAEDFEATNAINSLIQDNNKFLRTSVAGAQNSSFSILHNGQATMENETAVFSLPSLDLSGSNNMTLSFDYAFARIDTSSNDQLSVYMSTNCANTWIPRGNINTSALHTAGTTIDSNYVPTNNEWKSFSMSLSTFKTNPLLIQFRHLNPSNRLYVDNIQIQENNVSVAEQQLSEVNVFPNPTNEHLNISFSNEFQNTVKIKVLNLQGQTCMPDIETKSSHVQLNLASLPSGFYLLQIELNGYKSFKKVQKL